MFDSKYNKTEKSISSEGHLDHKVDWSLKPLIGLQFLGGINLRTTKSSNVMKNVLLAAWAAFLMVSNVAVNVSYASANFWIFSPIADTVSENAWGTFFWNPQAIHEFTCRCCNFFFFFFVPAVHLIFFRTVSLSPEWKELLNTFEDIHRSRKLTKCFYRKCRRLCSFFILVLVLVKTVSFYYKIIHRLLEIEMLHMCIYRLSLEILKN